MLFALIRLMAPVCDFFLLFSFFSVSFASPLLLHRLGSFLFFSAGECSLSLLFIGLFSRSKMLLPLAAAKQLPCSSAAIVGLVGQQKHLLSRRMALLCKTSK